MASKKTWQQCLTQHPLLQSKNFESGSRHCIAQHEGDLFVWRNEEKNLCFINLKRIQSNAQSGGKDREAADNFQALLCSQVPQFEVTGIKFSPAGQFVALLGRQQVMIMQLPTTRAHMGLFGDGRNEVSCRSFSLAARFLSATSHVDVLQFRWHPASSSETHVLLLTSDNIIRLYNFSQPQKSLHTYAVVPGSSGFADGSMSSLYDATRAISMANAESVVDFDVLPGDNVPSPAMPSSRAPVENTCCVFALMDSGDVYMLRSTLPSSASVVARSRSPVFGPLRMQPAAEDNYGSDSCAICCLESHPPALVVATAAGRLYHCLVMCEESTDDSQDRGDSGDAASTTTHGDPAYDRWAAESSDGEPILYVFEGLALALPDDNVEDTGSSDDHQQDSTSASSSGRLTLHRVGDANDGYFCSHGSGMHSVMLPWLQRMDRFCVEDGDEDQGAASIDELNLKQECHVEHLISTRPFKDSPASPLSSFCTVSHAFLGNTIVCVTNDGVCSTVDLRRSPATTATATSAQLTEAGGRSSAPDTLALSPFFDEVRKMLSERSAVPVLRLSGPAQQLSEKACAELMDKAINTFGDHVPIMRKVAAMIAKRAKALESQKKHQLRECAGIMYQFEEIKAEQEALNERAEVLVKSQDALTKRLFAVFHALEFKAPVRSVAEEQMAENLQGLSADVKKTQQLLETVKQKSKFHRSGSAKKTGELNEQHQQTLRSLIKQDTEDIERLVGQVKSLQLQT